MDAPRGGPGRGNKTDESDSSVLTFTTTAAKDAGVTERAVQTSIQIAKNLSPEVKDAIRGSELADRKTDLLNLARIKDPVKSRPRARGCTI